MTDEKKKETSPQHTLKAMMTSDAAKKQLALALPKHLTVDRFMRIILTAFNKTPKLLSCTKESLWSCLLDCSQIGIEPDGRRAHLIPYGDKCNLIIDYKGLVDLARRSGEISDIHADVVCENDSFEYSYGSEGKLIHRPALKNRGEVTQAYSFVKLKDGSTSYEVMNVDEVNAIRKRSKAGNNGPWVTDYNEMAKKTVFRRHSKWLPVSSEFQEAVDKDYDVPEDIINGHQDDRPVIEMPKPKHPEDDLLIGEAQQEMLKKLVEKRNIPWADFIAYLEKTYGTKELNQIRSEWIADISSWIGQYQSNA